MGTKENHEEIIFRSKLPDIYIRNHHFPLHTYCFENISKFSTRPCIIDGSTGVVYSFAAVELIVHRVASGLHKLDIQQGDVIMLLVNNTPEFIFAFLGASHLGAIVTTANPLFLPDEIEKQAVASGSKIIITQENYVEKVKDMAVVNHIKLICVDNAPEGCLHFSELSQSDENDIPEVKINPDDPVALIYSSGTTGLPKGVLLTHKGLITTVAQQVDGENPNLYLHSEDVILCVLPLFHIAALNTIMLGGLRSGSSILIIPKFEMNTFMELVQKHKVTFAPIAPPILTAMVKSPVADKYDLSSVRIVMSGAAPLESELEKAVKAKLPGAIIGQELGNILS